MADIAVTNVTHSVTRKMLEGQAKKTVVDGSLVFGDGVLTYPSGGVPFDKNKIGLPNDVESMTFVDPMSSDGFVYKIDLTNRKIRIYQGDNNNAADAALIELIAATATPAATTLKFTARGW